MDVEFDVNVIIGDVIGDISEVGVEESIEFDEFDVVVVVKKDVDMAGGNGGGVGGVVRR